MVKKAPAKAAAAKKASRKAPKAKRAATKSSRPKVTRKKVSNLAKANRAAEARRKRSLKAVSLYERALESLQRKKPGLAAPLFKRVIDEFPDERELHERSRRYLEVCERQKTPKPAPESLEERIYAATLALNAGSEEEALAHLEAAAALEPDSEQVQYMMAVARAAAGQGTTAVTHLNRAIELNPDNRYLARHEPTFEALHEDEAFQRMLASPSDDGSDPR